MQKSSLCLMAVFALALCAACSDPVSVDTGDGREGERQAAQRETAPVAESPPRLPAVSVVFSSVQRTVTGERRTEIRRLFRIPMELVKPISVLSDSIRPNRRK